MKDSMLHYSVGALLYCPANNESIVDSLSRESFGNFFSLALCLEDTIRDGQLAEAENILVHSLKTLFARVQIHPFYMPKIFIRVREPGQIRKLYSLLEEASELVTGFILPKFSTENADRYLNEMTLLNEGSSRTVYMMPILENTEIIHLQNRCQILYGLKEKLDRRAEMVLNIRVGGNDLCHAFGYRRSSTETIQEIKPVFHILSDILTAFGTDYVISGPVWEYYRGPGWDTGLKTELSLDRLNGFVGKTVIHPNQIPLVNSAYQVSPTDYKDAQSILNWNNNIASLVSGSAEGSRMNEYKTHGNWASKIMMLSQVYGIADQ